VRILIAEDETIIRLDVRTLLEKAGHEVVAEARDGEEAVALAAEHDPDLIVMDVRMPRLDGIEAARQISNRKAVPIVMLTAYAEEDLVTRASEAGAFAYLVKPFREVDLMPALNTARARFEELSALREEAADLTEAVASRKAVERAKGILMRKDGIDEAEAFRRIRAASQKTGRTMRVVADALIATFETDAAE
jgi:two-component system, response regulator PdtaR